MKKYMKLAAILILMVCILGVGCVKPATAKQITIAEQYGLAYAPLQIMKELKLLEKNHQGIEVVWKQMGNTAAIREAMLAKEVDIGFMAIPPFLIGWDKGMGWKIASGLSTSAVGLVTNKGSIDSIKDFTEVDRIALPQPGSVQHILLSMACERELNDPKKLDNNLVTMAHPDGLNALMAKKDITAHFTAPPYLTRELESKDNKLILSGDEAMGGKFTFIVGVTTKSFHDERGESYKAFVKSLNEAIDYLNNNRGEAVRILSKAYQLDEEEVEEYLETPGVEYNIRVQGIDKFADFMSRNGYIDKVPANKDDIMWDEAYYENE